jgi:hypothetical protein
MQINEDGLFVGLITSPNPADFTNNFNYIKKIFGAYKESLNNYNNKLDREYYKPLIYSIFGHYDFAVLSLVDDFVFGRLKFKPYSEMLLKEQDVVCDNFNYQVLNCIQVKGDGGDHIRNVMDSAGGYEFVSISALKIRSSLLIGTGDDMIQLIKKAVHRQMGDWVGKGIGYLLLETKSWHEMQLIIFGNNVNDMGNALVRVRELCCNAIEDGDTNKLLLQSLLNHRYEKEPGAPMCNMVSMKRHIHLFSSSYSYLGSKVFEVDGKPDTGRYNWKTFVKFYIKPGKLANVWQGIKNEFERNPGNDPEPVKANFIYGSGDFDFQGVDFDKYYHGVMKSDSYIKQIEPHIRRTKATAMVEVTEADILNVGANGVTGSAVNDGNDGSPVEPIYDFSIRPFLKKEIALDIKRFARIHDDLRKSRVDKAVANRIIKMFINYNDGVLDTNLYVYFIELSPIVNAVEKFINQLETNWHHYSIQEVQVRLNDYATIFEKAYKNKIQHSLRTVDLTDFNLEYNGGIQQIVSAYDYIFKLFRYHVGFYGGLYKCVAANETTDNPYACVAYVSNEPGIFSDKLSLHLNYAHVAQPEMLVATIFKETLNVLLQRIKWDFIYRTDELADETTYDASLPYVDEVSDYFFEQNVQNNSLQVEEVDETYRYAYFMEILKSEPKRLTAAVQKKVLNCLLKQQWDEIEKINCAEYILLMNQSFFEYFTYDYLNFVLYYKKNTAHYLFWFWNLAFQEGESYNRNGTLNEDAFVRKLARCIFLLNICNLGGEGAQSEYWNPIKKYPVAQRLFEQHWQPLNRYIDFLLNDQQCQLFDALMRFSDIKRYNNVLLDNIINNREQISNDDSSSEYLDCLDGEKHYTGIITKIREAADSGRECDAMIHFFQAYLHRIRQLTETGSGTATEDREQCDIITRNYKEVTVPQLGYKDMNHVYFDPLGGLFIVGNARNRYFVLRNTLLKVIVHFSYRFKMQQVRQLEALNPK